jgi:glycosyltransferase involved in cell wall biosynthesis
MKKRVLWYSDFLKPTGFGLVAENLIERLMPDFDIEVLAINYNGEPYNKPSSPYYKFKDIPVMPAMFQGDMFGHGKLLGMLIENDYDTLFILQDLFNILPIIDEILSIQAKKGFKIVMYIPIDGKPREEWIRVVDSVNTPVAYTNWGKGQLKRNIKHIYHGTDKSFYPCAINDFKQTYFNVPEDTIVITNVNRNQPRKDLHKTIAAYKIFEQKYPNSILYLHCDWRDSAGINLCDFIKDNCPELTTKIVRPPYMASKEGLNMIYNASDILVSSTLGEGWGLSTIEAMGCGTPVLIPDNTTAQEIVGDDRGFLCKSGSNPSLWVSNSFDNGVLRPIVDVEDMAEKMCYIVEHPEEAEQRAQNAMLWIKDNCDWDKIAQEWKVLL